ncbi:hypothetical protein GUITHDRAFT_122133 [Guillardia theta CCMP2712]|uniref:Uncharacterized protein n=1 Tax=Guillardia theta (strain CCMP2712) TaxID=905079 RepID=L1I6E9_GUITC|nr:hypothetical protein GUITHDRAFT_122133 [Guillardia theta CCMP2712]EKX31672.1 hypothetical protein GUITHDRAFT_122133 [Guillardia theta CCMP2712]|eukprot:XP_005818652.1 hypothetical protein GUITHDRAFT_122133 [Guillardia theta CCMP2712]
MGYSWVTVVIVLFIWISSCMTLVYLVKRAMITHGLHLRRGVQVAQVEDHQEPTAPPLDAQEDTGFIVGIVSECAYVPDCVGRSVKHETMPACGQFSRLQSIHV